VLVRGGGAPQKNRPSRSSKDCTRVCLILFGRSGCSTRRHPNSIRQVFWLTDHPTLLAFPSCSARTVATEDFVPVYSGGTAPDSRGIPYQARRHLMFMHLHVTDL